MYTTSHYLYSVYYLTHAMVADLSVDNRSYRQEGWILSTLILLLIVLIIVMIFLPYSPQGNISNVIAPAIGGVIGALIPLTYDRLTKPEIRIGDPFIETEDEHPMPRNTRHLRLPVDVERATVKEVQSKIIGGSQEFIPRGKRDLLLTRNYKDHSNAIHYGLSDAIDVLCHMGKYHLRGAGPIGSISSNGNPEYVNLVMKIEGLPATFVANAEGKSPGKYQDWEAFRLNYNPDEDNRDEFCTGEFKLKIEITGEETRSKARQYHSVPGLNLVTYNWMRINL